MVDDDLTSGQTLDQSLVPETEDRDLRSVIADAVERQRAPVDTIDKPGALDAEDEAARAARARDDKGRFSEKTKEDAAGAVGAPAALDQPAPGAPAKATPPSSWSPAAKVAFDTLSPEVRDAIAKREAEIADGSNKHQAYRAEMKEIEPFAEMARQSGVTLAQALRSYTGIEQALKQDFLGGIGQICRNMGADPVAVAQAILARAGGAPQSQAPQQAAPDLSPLLQKIQNLEAAQQQREQAATQAQIIEFASKNRFFDNVKPQMAQFLRSGAYGTLQDAYDAACWATPEIRTILVKEQGGQANPQAQQAAAVAQARQQAKAVGGAPPSGASVKTAPAGNEHASTRDSIRAAIAAQRGRA